MGISLSPWRVIGLVALMLALAAAPLRGWAAPTPASPDPCAAAMMHHGPGSGDPGMMSPDCLMVCMVGLPAIEAPAVAEPTSYVLRFRDVDVVRPGLTHRPEPPPPR